MSLTEQPAVLPSLEKAGCFSFPVNVAVFFTEEIEKRKKLQSLAIEPSRSSSCYNAPVEPIINKNRMERIKDRPPLSICNNNTLITTQHNSNRVNITEISLTSTISPAINYKDMRRPLLYFAALLCFF